MNGDTATSVSAIAQLVSAGGILAFAVLTLRLLDRFLAAQAKRDEARDLAQQKRDETAAEERAAMFRFMGVLEERSRVEADERRRERVRTNPYGVPSTTATGGRRRTHSDTETEE